MHTEYSVCSVDTKKEFTGWNAFDPIMAVSDDVRNQFILLFPELAKKTNVMENIISPDFVREQADLRNIENELDLTDHQLCLGSVGRFGKAKNFDNVPFICQLLKNNGISFKWFLIGYGGDEPLIRKNIEQANVEDCCIILGKKSNPYPYMKRCDLYIQPSRFEGKAVTVREAQILCKPVIITDFSTAKSQVKNGVDGIIVPMSNELIAENIIAFFKNKIKQQQIMSYLQSHDYGNESEIAQIDLYI